MQVEQHVLQCCKQSVAIHAAGPPQPQLASVSTHLQALTLLRASDSSCEWTAGPLYTGMQVSADWIAVSTHMWDQQPLLQQRGSGVAVHDWLVLHA